MTVQQLWESLAHVKDFITNGPSFEVKIVVDGVEKDIVEFRAVGADKVLFPVVSDEQNRVKIKV
jgi:hypothetical protein